jgi:3-oxoacyl-[acyl-carrier protein] reductase
MKLAKKVVLITGASRGIGRAIALLFASEGADVAIHCHSFKEDEKSLLTEIKTKYKHRAEVFPADVTDLSAIKKMVDGVVKKFGRIDVLINNAGFYPENSFFESTIETWEKTMNTNLRSTYFCSQDVSKIMLKQKTGNIINMVSVAGLFPRKSNFEYAISKAGMIHFTKSLALILAPHIRVNAIAPSYTWTSFMSFMKDKKKVAEKMKLIPLRRFNDADDVAKSALFLACEDSKNVTGQVLVIDGGRGANI